jgi:hypothetical protein
MAISSGPSRADFQQLADSRLTEAKALLANNLFDGAVYLAGYALELALKARICKILDTNYPSNTYKSFFTHRHEELILLAGLTTELRRKQADPDFNTNWSLLVGGHNQQGWSESWRYRKIGSVSQQDAQDFIDALDDLQSGILTWLKTLW